MVILLPIAERERYTAFLRYYFDLFESELYHPSFVGNARVRFINWALQSTTIETILDGYIDREMAIWRTDYMRSK